MDWYLEVLRKYATFDGRARRTEYWMFFLFNMLIGIVLSVIVNILGGFGNMLSSMYSLAILIPSIAVGIRRLHDTGRSGWYLLISLIPVVGLIILIVFLAQEGQPGDNQYGSNPKASI